MIKFLDLQAQYRSIQPQIDAAISRTIADAAFIGGDAVRSFEAAFAKYQEAAHCVGVANGTDAIEIALEGLALPRGSEVIVPANTFIGTSEAVTRAGLRVVFADVDPDDFTLSPVDVRRRLSQRTRAILAVHLYGQPCDMLALGSIAQQHGLRIIEDCAQAHGAEVKGRRVGAIGDVGAFSFYPGKNLGAYGDAGAILTNDESLALRMRKIANHGRTAKYDHEFEGRNSRLDGLQAAILLAKLEFLDGWLEQRRRVAAVYDRLLAGVPEVRLPRRRSDVTHSYHLYVVRVRDRDSVAQRLRDHGIETSVHYPIALPRLRAYAYLGAPDESMVALQQDSQLLSLPIGEHLSEAQAETVALALREAVS